MNVAGCTIKNTFKGIKISKCKDVVIQSNDIYEIGSEELRIEHVGDRAKLISSNVLIDNNYIHHTGRVSFTAFINLSTSVGVAVSHNLMHDSPKGGISHGRLNNCLFEYNEMHNIALKPVGFITGKRAVTRGTKISLSIKRAIGNKRMRVLYLGTLAAMIQKMETCRRSWRIRLCSRRLIHVWKITIK